MGEWGKGPIKPHNPHEFDEKFGDVSEIFSESESLQMRGWEILGSSESGVIFACCKAKPKHRVEIRASSADLYKGPKFFKHVHIDELFDEITAAGIGQSRIPRA